ncbi:fructose-bisphosphatase class II family protein [Chloroflexi bacterium TSY]|nr:fructose-bisphosphatase class II family protein [Chloroflexi bacterium TSY]
MITSFERTLGLDFIRATEAAALNCFSWVGRGEKELADAAASDAIRGTFDLMDVSGEVVIGEGIKDNAPGLFKGERVGTWSEGSMRLDIALDPIDGTTNLSKGLPNAISCIAASLHEGSSAGHDDDVAGLLDVPAFYLDKLSYGQTIRDAFVRDPSLPLSVDSPPDETIKLAARLLSKEIKDVVITAMDRPRNAHVIETVRGLGANLRMVSDGDITAALAPAMPASGIDLYMGIGGAPEGVLSAAGMRCLGGGLQAKIWPRDEAEKTELIEIGWGEKLETVFLSKDLARGDQIIFAATAILESPFLPGMTVTGRTALTHSVLMRVRNRTVRYITSYHNLDYKEIPLRSKNQNGQN